MIALKAEPHFHSVKISRRDRLETCTYCYYVFRFPFFFNSVSPLYLFYRSVVTFNTKQSKLLLCLQLMVLSKHNGWCILFYLRWMMRMVGTSFIIYESSILPLTIKDWNYKFCVRIYWFSYQVTCTCNSIRSEFNLHSKKWFAFCIEKGDWIFIFFIKNQFIFISSSSHSNSLKDFFVLIFLYCFTIFLIAHR